MSSWDKAPSHNDFIDWRIDWLSNVVAQQEKINIIQDGVLELDNLKSAYLWDWCGVPIIRHPSDIVLVQEFIFRFKPTICIEIGVARGGGVVLYSSLMQMVGIEPKVLGIDIKIHPHTFEAIKASGKAGIQLLETSSTSELARAEVIRNTVGHKSIFVTLDANHEHESVLKELRMFDEILPKGSVVLACDTIADLLPRTVDSRVRNGFVGNSPKTALDEFLSENNNWREFSEFNLKSIFGESPNGWLIKN